MTYSKSQGKPYRSRLLADISHAIRVGERANDFLAGSSFALDLQDSAFDFFDDPGLILISLGIAGIRLSELYLLADRKDLICRVRKTGLRNPCLTSRFAYESEPGLVFIIFFRLFFPVIIAVSTASALFAKIKAAFFAKEDTLCLMTAIIILSLSL